MGNLSKIVFGKNVEHSFELEGHTFVVRKLTARDVMNLEIDASEMQKEEVTLKTMLQSTIDVLASVIVSIDGEVPDNKAETKEWLLGQEQSLINEIFTKSEIYGKDLSEDLKNSEGTPPSAPDSK